MAKLDDWLARFLAAWSEAAPSPRAPTSVDEADYKHHFELLDRYQGFSAEILRMGLAAVAGLGFFLSIHDGSVGMCVATHMYKDPIPHNMVIIALGLLAISAASALFHRYVSSDAMYYILQGLRRPLDAGETCSKNLMLRCSELAIWLAPTALAAGVSALAIAFALAWGASDTPQNACPPPKTPPPASASS